MARLAARAAARAARGGAAARAVLARRRERRVQPAAAARRRAQCGRGAAAPLARRAKLFRLPRLTSFLVTTHALSTGLAHRLRAFYALTKPRVVSLIVFTAV